MNKFVDGVKQMDGFSHNQFLRYRKEDNYKTFLGGFVTISLILLFLGLFSKLISNTINKHIINGSTTRTFQVYPQPYTLEVSAQKKFMFAFGLVYMDMNSNKRYFDVTFEQITLSDSILNMTSKVILPFTPCKKTQWAGINPQIQQGYDSLKMDELLCLQTNQKLELQGRWSSKLIKIGQINVRKCTQNATLFPNTTCASQSDFQEYVIKYGGFIAMFYFINANINSQSHEVINYYLQQKNWVHFDLTYGSLAEMYFSEYSIKTDDSILPWTQISEAKGLYVDTSYAYIQRRSVADGRFFVLNLVKSEFRYDFVRSYRKFDQTFSYIGGLYGAIVILLTFLQVYSKYSYEIQFGDRLYKKNDKSSFSSEKFNFIIFLGYAFFNVLAMLGLKLKWKRMKQYHECRLQCLKQLDISLFFKKMQFFQQIADIILEEHHLVGVHLLPKKTIGQSKQNRKQYLLQGIMYRQLNKRSTEIHTQTHEHKERYNDFMNNIEYEQYFKKKTLPETKGSQQRSDPVEQDKHMTQTAISLKFLSQTSTEGDIRSKRIWDKIRLNNEIFKHLLATIEPTTNKMKIQQNMVRQEPDDIYSSERIMDSDEIANQNMTL